MPLVIGLGLMVNVVWNIINKEEVKVRKMLLVRVNWSIPRKLMVSEVFVLKHPDHVGGRE